MTLETTTTIGKVPWRVGIKMSVDLAEILKDAGYDIKNNIEDAKWLLSQEAEFNDLLEAAEKLLDDWTDYENFIFIDAQSELGNLNSPTFEEWKEERKNGNE